MNEKALVFGEALWDLLPAGPVLGGAPLNFAYRLGTMGVPTRFVSQVGSDELGRRTITQMERLGMDTSLISESGDLPTATVEVELDENRQPHYTIVEDVAYDAIPWSETLKEAASEATLLCFGTLAQRDSRSRETLHRIVQVFGGHTILVDINLRPRCYTADTVRWSLDHGTIAKLNDDELLELAGLYGVPKPREGVADDMITAVAVAFRAAARLDTLVVTRGAHGAFAVHQGRDPVAAPGFTVEVDDPCGAGDAFAGMFMASVLNGRSLKESLTRANALGALVATQPGATQPVELSDIESLIWNHTPREATS